MTDDERTTRGWPGGYRDPGRFGWSGETMLVGILQVRLDLPGVRSLKEKRSIVRRLLSRVKEHFEISAAEVAHMDLWNTSGLGFAMVGNEAGPLQSRLREVVSFIEREHLGAVADYRVEVIA
ncbi:MAG: DUF503 domain-containing protein [Magnetococcales bacterium]|nr:DUF503 domain-containing protein [Magnetococcales bacterium]